MRHTLHTIILAALILFCGSSPEAKSDTPVRVNLVAIPNPHRFVKDLVGTRKLDRVLEAACPTDGVLVIAVARPRDTWSGIATTAVDRSLVLKGARAVIQDVAGIPPYTNGFAKDVANIKRSLHFEYAGAVIFNEITLGSPSASYTPTPQDVKLEIIQPPPVYAPGKEVGKQTAKQPALPPAFLPWLWDAAAFAVPVTGVAGIILIVGYRTLKRRNRAQEERSELEEQRAQRLAEAERNTPRRFASPAPRVFVNGIVLCVLLGVAPGQVFSQTVEPPAKTDLSSTVAGVQAGKLPSSKKPQLPRLSALEGDHNIVDVSGSTAQARKQAKKDIRARLALGESRQFLWVFGDSLVWIGEITAISQLDTLDRIKAHKKTRLTEPVLKAIALADSLSARRLKADFILYSDFLPDDEGNATLEFIGDLRSDSVPTTTTMVADQITSPHPSKEILLLLVTGAVLLGGIVLLRHGRQRMLRVPKRVLLTAAGRTREVQGKEVLSRIIKIGNDIDADMRIGNGETTSVSVSGTAKAPALTFEHLHADNTTRIELQY